MISLLCGYIALHVYCSNLLDTNTGIWAIAEYGKTCNDRSNLVAAKQKMKTTTETQRIAELKKGGRNRISFLLVFSVPLW